ncbi:hypothetical protein PLEOSDRAFT_158514 [Pleurotus ostreatus PC15]|uniref:HhH-GPD domain-containing protein n=1 Tax=Pleurotus ostreatus (strain PC15) TaxID=1137138 RepID=A0A067NHU5_PLEO1|nr:hypothetical protein PLEOSDRAFT_158514 [Pleurotus ostreatus PC15]
MRVTRSASKAASASTPVETPPQATPARTVAKRKAASTGTGSKKPRKATKNERTAEEGQEQEETPATLVFAIPPRVLDNDSDVVPAVLSFSFEEAKNHLIKADPRFEGLFNEVTCKPYEKLERVHPFQALATSILGQQISWMAARSINHRFVRLYNPTLPEKPSDVVTDTSDLFPTPDQVAKTDLNILRTAGLSGRKAEYVQDLASRFADGRLSTSKLLNANDEELAEMLIEVRGIGRWTVDMFAIFSLRRPDILPVGDLGVQRGVARWFLALHSPTYNISISPDKVTGGELKSTPLDKDDEDDDEEGTLPVFGTTSTTPVEPQDVSSVPPGGVAATPMPDGSKKNVAAMPPPLTPATRKILTSTSAPAAPLPGGLTASDLKSRLDGKKKIKGALITPQEMEELTTPWKPYRSLAVYYMWALADG